MKKSELKQIIKEELQKVLNEENLGMSLKSLPVKIKRKMDYEYDSNTPEYDLAIGMLQKYLQNNLTKLEDGKSIYSISNQGEDLQEIADLLETTPHRYY
jgi:hypothetical protein